MPTLWSGHYAYGSSARSLRPQIKDGVLLTAEGVFIIVNSSFNDSQEHVLMDYLKPRPNDRNMPTQHVATLLGATCCVLLATVLRHVGCCWLKFDHFQQHPTCRNTSQHGGQTHATCCAQQCCDMLRWHVAIVWPGLKGLCNASVQ